MQRTLGKALSTARGAHFVNAQYTNGSFLEADLTETDFYGCDLSGSDFALRRRRQPTIPVADGIGVCRKTICNWLCVTEFVAEVDRLSCMIDISSRAERLRIAMRAVRQKVRADGTPETDKDVLDWLKFAQSETTGIKLGFSKGEVAELDQTIHAAWQESVEEEVNRRLAARGFTIELPQSNGSPRQIHDAADTLILTPRVNR